MRNRDSSKKRPECGMTLIEVLVVLVVIGILIALLLPAVQKTRAAAAKTHCAVNLREIGLALNNYYSVKKQLPPGTGSLADPYPHLSWQARLLPFIDQPALWKGAELAYQESLYPISSAHYTIFSTVVPLLSCPADGRASTAHDVYGSGTLIAFTSYFGVEGRNLFTKDGVLFVDSRVRLDQIFDGTSNTICVGERPISADGTYGSWYIGVGQDNGSAGVVLGSREFNIRANPTGPFALSKCPRGPYSYAPGTPENPCDQFHFWSHHVHGSNFVFCDGSVRFLSYSADAVLPALSTIAGNEAPILVE